MRPLCFLDLDIANMNRKDVVEIEMYDIPGPCRGVNGGWAGWAIAHTFLGKILMRRQEQLRAAQ